MPKLSADRTVEKITVRVWADVADYLRKKAEENPEVKFNFLLREIIAGYVRQMRAREDRMIDSAERQFEKTP